MDTCPQHLMIERAHYCAQLIWVMGNTVWAYGEFYFANYDAAYSMGERSVNKQYYPPPSVPVPHPVELNQLVTLSNSFK